MTRRVLALLIGAVIILLATTLVACGTKPGSDKEKMLVEQGIEKGLDPLEALYQANMDTSADEKTIARMLLEVAKGQREQNRILAEIRDELRALRALLPAPQTTP